MMTANRMKTGAEPTRETSRKSSTVIPRLASDPADEFFG